MAGCDGASRPWLHAVYLASVKRTTGDSDGDMAWVLPSSLGLPVSSGKCLCLVLLQQLERILSVVTQCPWGGCVFLTPSSWQLCPCRMEAGLRAEPPWGPPASPPGCSAWRSPGVFPGLALQGLPCVLGLAEVGGAGGQPLLGGRCWKPSFLPYHRKPFAQGAPQRSCQTRISSWWNGKIWLPPGMLT